MYTRTKKIELTSLLHANSNQQSSMSQILTNRRLWTLAARIYMGHRDVGKQLDSRIKK